MPAREPTYESEPSLGAYPKLVEQAILLASAMNRHELPTRSVRKYDFQLHPEQYVDLPPQLRVFLDPDKNNAFTIEVISEVNEQGVNMSRVAISLTATSRFGEVFITDKLMLPRTKSLYTVVFVSGSDAKKEAVEPIAQSDINRLVLSTINEHYAQETENEPDILDPQFADQLVPALEIHCLYQDISMSYESPESTVALTYEGDSREDIPASITVYLRDKRRKLEMDTTSNFQLSLFEDDSIIHHPDHETIMSFHEDIKGLIDYMDGNEPIEIVTDPLSLDTLPDVT